MFYAGLLTVTLYTWLENFWHITWPSYFGQEVLDIASCFTQFFFSHANHHCFNVYIATWVNDVWRVGRLWIKNIVSQNPLKDLEKKLGGLLAETHHLTAAAECLGVLSAFYTVIRYHISILTIFTANSFVALKAVATETTYVILTCSNSITHDVNPGRAFVDV